MHTHYPRIERIGKRMEKYWISKDSLGKAVAVPDMYGKKQLE